jgi:hypothetical protein
MVLEVHRPARLLIGGGGAPSRQKCKQCCCNNQKRPFHDFCPQVWQNAEPRALLSGIRVQILGCALKKAQPHLLKAQLE